MRMVKPGAVSGAPGLSSHYLLLLHFGLQQLLDEGVELMVGRVGCQVLIGETVVIVES